MLAIKRQFGKLLLDGLLIVFSVLFALYINRLSENAKMAGKKSVAMERLKKELLKNEAIIEIWYDEHSTIRDKITKVVENEQDSLRIQLLQYEYLNLGVLTGDKSLIEAVLTDVSWEAAKATDIIAELDYELVEKLTHAYTMQQHLIDDTLKKILDLYFDQSSHDMTNFDPIMRQYQLRFFELAGQEALLKHLYQTAINELDKQSL